MTPVYNETGLATTVDRVEAALAQFPQCEMPLVHRFTPGLYTRQITMPTNAVVISKIHKTQHPFFIIKGSANVWTEGKGVQRFTAPYVGITEPGTRRVIFIPEECVWLTVHATPDTDLEKIEDQVILKRVNPLLSVNPDAPAELPQILHELRNA